MTTEDNKNLLRNFIDDVWNNHNTDNVNQYVSDDYVEHNPFGDFEGIEAFRNQFLGLSMEGFPDFSIEVHQITGDENMAACYYTTEGTHSNDFGPLEATNQTVRLNGCVVCRIENGKITEAWNQFDLLSFLVQLGVTETPDFLTEMQEGMTTGEMGGRPGGRPGA